METDEIPLSQQVHHKVVLMGDAGVGKTCIVLRLKENMYLANYQPTVGPGVFSKEFDTLKGTVGVNIWDTAGEERYRSFTGLYSQGAKAAILVYDITDRTSFESIPEWVEMLHENADPNCLIYIVGNKLDLDEKRQITYRDALDFCTKNNYQITEVSAKTGENISELFLELANLVGERTHAYISALPASKNQNSNCC